ncbi:FecR family protein [Comamonas antarctica]|uniref:FecR domain-containing protein n=1 Tax=Comamonas antarctica TaxID=2743470 RepID=A0A6N1X3X2_9BURK|nr:FecR domain-containing protein [Comamonas antarctica]QKV54164.1 FecR domain-containing protein [Comamonas antarctica]
MTKPLPPGTDLSAMLHMHRAVAGWYVRREQPGWTAADEREMQAWLEADPRRRDIMDAMRQTVQLAGQLPEHRPETYGRRAAAVPAVPPAARQAARRPWFTPARRRSLAPVLAAGCMALAVAGWFRWDNTAGYQLALATGPGETRSVDLPDGSQIALNTGTSVQVRYYPRRREVAMAGGEAFFRVAADASRPFTIDSADSRVRVVGTAFNVRAAPQQLAVQVLEGKVEVQPRRSQPADPVLLLGAGTGVDIDPSTGRYASLRVAPEEVGRWRTGQIQFSRTSLQDIAQELGRYLGKTITIADPGLGSLTISGFLMTSSAEDFLQALPDVVPVRVDKTADGNWRIARR